MLTIAISGMGRSLANTEKVRYEQGVCTRFAIGAGESGRIEIDPLKVDHIMKLSIRVTTKKEHEKSVPCKLSFEFPLFEKNQYLVDNLVAIQEELFSDGITNYSYVTTHCMQLIMDLIRGGYCIEQ